MHQIQEADRIVQRIGRIGKAATPPTSLPLNGRRKSLNMPNAITVSALLLASAVMNDATAAQTSAPQITITPTAAQNVITGSLDRFTGSVRVQSLFDPTESSRTSGGAVTFRPGARSALHTHPLGQILIVTDDVGWIQQWGLWQRPELSPRDRSIVTVAALIARIQTIEMPYHFALATDCANDSRVFQKRLKRLRGRHNIGCTSVT